MTTFLNSYLSRHHEMESVESAAITKEFRTITEAFNYPSIPFYPLPFHLSFPPSPSFPYPPPPPPPPPSPSFPPPLPTVPLPPPPLAAAGGRSVLRFSGTQVNAAHTDAVLVGATLAARDKGGLSSEGASRALERLLASSTYRDAVVESTSHLESVNARLKESIAAFGEFAAR